MKIKFKLLILVLEGIITLIMSILKVTIKVKGNVNSKNITIETREKSSFKITKDVDEVSIQGFQDLKVSTPDTIFSSSYSHRDSRFYANSSSNRKSCITGITISSVGLFSLSSGDKKTTFTIYPKENSVSVRIDVFDCNFNIQPGMLPVRNAKSVSVSSKYRLDIFMQHVQRNFNIHLDNLQVDDLRFSKTITLNNGEVVAKSSIISGEVYTFYNNRRYNLSKGDYLEVSPSYLQINSLSFNSLSSRITFVLKTASTKIGSRDVNKNIAPSYLGWLYNKNPYAVIASVLALVVSLTWDKMSGLSWTVEGNQE